MNSRREEFTPYWLQTGMPSIENVEMPGQTVMFPWEYPWPHTSPPAMWPASNPSGSSALPPALASAPHKGADAIARHKGVEERHQPAKTGVSALMSSRAMDGRDALTLRGLMPSNWDPSSPSLWHTPAGADAQFPAPPLPTDPAERAALRMRQSVQPDGGRKTGTSTQTLEDMVTTIPSALARGTAATLGAGADARESVLGAGKWVAGKLGYEPSPEQMEMIRREVRKTLMNMPGGSVAAGPTSETMVKGIEAVTGPLYHPQTPGGKFVNSGAELVPGAAFGGLAAGGLRAVLGHIVRAGIIPGLTSEAAGQLTEGTAAEPVARLLAGLAGYGAATAAHAGRAPGGWLDKARKAGTEFSEEAPMLGQHLYHQAAEAKERQRLQAQHEQEKLRRIMGGGGR
jgi:hypothetical protein